MTGTEMKRILFITDRYYPDPYANGICVHYVARSFVEAGHNAHILAYDIPGRQLPEKKDGVRVFGIRPDIINAAIFSGQNQIETAKGKLLRAAGIGLLRLNKIRLISQYPLASASYYKKLSRRIRELDEQYHYDAIIAAYNPLDAVLAVSEYKKVRSDILSGIYNLDFMPESIGRKVSSEKVVKSCAYWQERIYPQVDLILEMASNYERWGEDYQHKWAEKLAVADLPLLVKEDVETTGVLLDHTCENWVYAGALDTTYYQVEDALRIFCALPEEKKRVLHIYGRGTGYELCRRYETEYPDRIKVHGFLPHDELKGILQEADVLLSMKKTDLISGKTFEYMATGRPIVHLQGNERDPNAVYLKKYGRSIIINTYSQNNEKAAAQLAAGLQFEAAAEKGGDILREFVKNQPDYTRDLILSKLK